MKRPFLFTVCCILAAIFTFDSCKNDEDELPPVIASINPTHGPVGTSVTITGSNFSNDAAVFFNGAEGTVTNVSRTEIVVTVPENATSGTLSIKSNNRSAVGPDFTVEFPPAITSINPVSGKAGDQVTISGNNFSAQSNQNIVKFNGVMATVTSASAAQLTVTVPNSVTTGPVTVTVNSLTGTGPVFSIIPPPTITSITPASGKVGDAVTIVGTNFGTTISENTVKFNGTTSVVTSASSTQLITTVPAGATTGNVLVSVNGQQVTGTSFTVIPPPTITSIDPTSGKVGDNITIAGTNFSATLASNEVKFNGTVATVSAASATQLTVVVPAGATSGSITVTTNGMTATSTSFTVIPPPTITTINPTSGLPGSNVTITGTNFNGSPAANTVKFNGVAATVSTASSTELVVVVPGTATTGAVSVEVNGISVSGPTFTVIPPVTITSISPQAGPACTSVTINGTNFSTTAADNVVKINGVSVTVTSASETQLVATVGSSVTTGAVTVTTNSQTATGSTFTVTPNEATMTMDAIDYTYTNFCTAIVSNRFWISASGGFNSPKPSWGIQFTGLRPTTAGAYTADIFAERPGETWNATPATVNVSFDSEGRMVISFTNVLLSGRSGTADKLFSGTVKVY
jgi:hypothetical protein